MAILKTIRMQLKRGKFEIYRKKKKFEEIYRLSECRYSKNFSTVLVIGINEASKISFNLAPCLLLSHEFERKAKAKKGVQLFTSEVLN